MNVISLGWGASQDAIRAASTIAGHEPVATRVRRKPVAIVEPDYAQEAIDARRLGRPKRVATVIDLDEARKRRSDRADPDHSNRLDQERVRAR